MSEDSRELAIFTRWNEVKPDTWGDGKYRAERMLLPSLLEESESLEHVVASNRVVVGSSGAYLSGIVVATTSRLLVVDKGKRGSYKTSSIAYEDITEVVHKSGWISSSIEIKGLERHKVTNVLEKEAAKALSDHIEARAPTVPVSGSTVSDHGGNRSERPPIAEAAPEPAGGATNWVLWTIVGIALFIGLSVLAALVIPKEEAQESAKPRPTATARVSQASPTPIPTPAASTSATGQVPSKVSRQRLYSTLDSLGIGLLPLNRHDADWYSSMSQSGEIFFDFVGPSGQVEVVELWYHESVSKSTRLRIVETLIDSFIPAHLAEGMQWFERAANREGKQQTLIGGMYLTFKRSADRLGRTFFSIDSEQN